MRAIGIALLATAMLMLGYEAGRGDFQPPPCPEDAVLLGVGNYEDGRWDAYWCGPARDDYKKSSYIDDKHPAHERAERFVCNHPTHAYRAHGLRILPEACG
jgi:hypothetical protein